MAKHFLHFQFTIVGHSSFRFSFHLFFLNLILPFSHQAKGHVGRHNPHSLYGTVHRTRKVFALRNGCQCQSIFLLSPSPSSCETLLACQKSVPLKRRGWGDTSPINHAYSLQMILPDILYTINAPNLH